MRLQAGFLRRVGAAVLTAAMALTIAAPTWAGDDDRSGNRRVDPRSGQSPLGVEWTRMLDDGIGGVEWSRAFVEDLGGVEWTGLD